MSCERETVDDIDELTEYYETLPTEQKIILLKTVVCSNPVLKSMLIHELETHRTLTITEQKILSRIVGNN